MKVDKMERFSTPEIHASYSRDGFVVLRGYLLDTELEILRRETERRMEGYKWYPGYEGLRKNLQRGDAFFGNWLVYGSHKPLLAWLVEDDVVPGWGVAYFDKPLGCSSPVAPHRDGGGPVGGATIWVALDNADLGNGCMHYTPGSHLTVDPSKDVFDFTVTPEETACAIPVETVAGDAIVHSQRCVHFSKGSGEPRRRRAVSAMYWDATSYHALEARGKIVPGGQAVL
eukprot:CAMPEP_0172912858 /NCGR_PEP_ID=MMETSP1075-20121228/189236_1 /TAXON_ID=2916 /ORGANISM="Ceratium fusus, Strain PA161109" /LENGTH=227 /DNA_ID=CAMNT_0013771451 /DNA_START=115 /DNA_END=798 /DNA_ORIENTATION=+